MQEVIDQEHLKMTAGAVEDLNDEDEDEECLDDGDTDEEDEEDEDEEYGCEEPEEEDGDFSGNLSTQRRRESPSTLRTLAGKVARQTLPRKPNRPSPSHASSKQTSSTRIRHRSSLTMLRPSWARI